ncbi:Ribokinase-like protein [Crassisporium funariophilum]|nr:Ribokinase-like protein [Crassisporium funariophilum]
MTTTTTDERVLSIQSHVVFGYVGGKAAVFPLQCLGYDVDVVNTVNFSNHAGYGRSGGSKTTAKEMEAIFESMEGNELMMPTRLLTGYIPGAEALSAVEKLVKRLKETKDELIYLLDPVMGDAGRLYVAPDVIPVYQRMLPLATIITPNWFEVEILTNTKLTDLPSLQRALRILHTEHRVPNVVISSIPLKPWLAALLPPSISLLHSRTTTSGAAPPTPSPSEPSSSSRNSECGEVPVLADDDTSYLLCLCSSASVSTDATETPSTVHVQIVPLIPGYFSGVGDLFSALLLAHYPAQSPRSSSRSTTTAALPAATHLSLQKTHAILRLTHAHTLTLPACDRQPSDDELDAEEPLRKTRRMRGRELRLVQGQDILRGDEVDGGRGMNPLGAIIARHENDLNLERRGLMTEFKARAILVARREPNGYCSDGMPQSFDARSCYDHMGHGWKMGGRCYGRQQMLLQGTQIRGSCHF